MTCLAPGPLSGLASEQTVKLDCCAPSQTTIAHPRVPGKAPLLEEDTRYPTAFIDVWRLRDGTRLTLRPVLPQDAGDAVVTS